MQISFDPSRILKQDEVLRLRNGNLYVENSNYRRSRFFLIRFLTRNQYDQNEIISKLIKTAISIQSIPARIDLGNSYLDAAQEQLNRAKLSNADLSRFGLIRWLRGTPVVNCTKLEKALELTRNLIKVQKPPVQPQTEEPQKYTKPEASPIKISEVSREYTKVEVREILEEALKDCKKNSAFSHHSVHLKKFITILDKREKIIDDYLKIYKDRSCFYSDPISGYALHGEEQCPIPLLRTAPEYYAQVFDQIKNDERKKISFFTKVFSGNHACLEGNFKTIQSWEYSLKKLEFQFDSTNNYLNHLGEIHRVFKEHKFLNYFKENLCYDEFNQFYDSHLKIYTSYFEAPWITNYHNKDDRYVFKSHWDGMRIFQDTIDTKENLLAFILEKKCLPLKCSDKELTENNIKEHLDQYYLLVFGE